MLDCDRGLGPGGHGPRGAPRGCLLAGRATRVAPLSSGLASHERLSLPGLAMQRMTAAPAAVLAQLHAVRGVPLGLLRLVVAPLAVGAGERDRDSDSGGHVLSFWSGLKGTAKGSGGRTRTYDTRIMIPLL